MLDRVREMAPDLGGGPVMAGRMARGRDIALVLGLPTVVFLIQSVLRLAIGPQQPHFTDARLLATLAEECAFAALFLPLLRRRGWTPSGIAGAPVPLDVLHGLLLWVATCAASAFAITALGAAASVMGIALSPPTVSGSVSMSVALAVVFLNPVFEELLWLGYAIPVLAPRIGVPRACLVSIALRTAVHVYQGPVALVGIAAFGLVFAVYYVRTGRIWPVIVAHLLADATGLAVLHRS